MQITRAEMGTFTRFHDAFFHLIYYMIQVVRRKQNRLKHKHYTNRPEASTNTKLPGAVLQNMEALIKLSSLPVSLTDSHNSRCVSVSADCRTTDKNTQRNREEKKQSCTTGTGRDC
jgi:hypothetical protein